MERGIAVHEWAEGNDEGQNVQPPSPHEGFCNAYKSFSYTMSPSWTHIEQPFDNGSWHGIIDRIGYLRGHDRLVMADLKTGPGSGKEAQRRIATQLACYAMGWDAECYKEILRVGIYLSGDGTWKTIVYDQRSDFEHWRQLLQGAMNGTQEDTHGTQETPQKDQHAD